MVLIFLTNTFKVGIYTSAIYPEYLKEIAIYATSTIHYTSVLLIGIYILLVAENGAKIGIPFCVSLVRLLKVKIKKFENDEN